MQIYLVVSVIIRNFTRVKGWGDTALPDSVGGWFWVYILAPIVGASIAAVFFKYVLEPINEKKNHNN